MTMCYYTTDKKGHRSIYNKHSLTNITKNDVTHQVNITTATKFSMNWNKLCYKTVAWCSHNCLTNNIFKYFTIMFCIQWWKNKFNCELLNQHCLASMMGWQIWDRKQTAAETNNIWDENWEVLWGCLIKCNFPMSQTNVIMRVNETKSIIAQNYANTNNIKLTIRFLYYQ